MTKHKWELQHMTSNIFHNVNCTASSTQWLGYINTAGQSAISSWWKGGDFLFAATFRPTRIRQTLSQYMVTWTHQLCTCIQCQRLGMTAPIPPYMARTHIWLQCQNFVFSHISWGKFVSVLVYIKHYLTYFKQIPLTSNFILALATMNYYTIYLIKLRYIPQKGAIQ